ncbi:rhodanese-like domain-containing protein [Desulfovibrio inopinatus]|uniref:rhodanese-like domain-containing protein n=1 Tax=Desulfovibrio inopinatus TaxID=102109 RepID=UPI00041D8B93|nr:rhodanese-like domain-containing protein [Desulfovibrio inopinatus]
MANWKWKGIRAGLQAFGLLLLAVILAYASDMVRPYFGGQSLHNSVESAKSNAPRQLTIEEAKRLLDEHQAIFVDARSSEEFSQGHIPTAMNVPQEAIYGDFEAAVSNIPKSNLILVYCSDAACSKSHEVAEGLVFLEFPNVAVMPDGMTGWIHSGGDVEVTQ